MSAENYLEVSFKEITSNNGLFCQFDDHHGVLLLDVKNSFSTEDFKIIEDIIEPYFKQHGELKGVIINSKKFPRWSGFQNRQEYLDFAGNHHHKFKKAALNMGGFFIKIITRIARGKVHPEIKIFKYQQIEKAQEWILKGETDYAILRQ